MEACGEEVVGELDSLGKAIDTFANFETDPSITGFVGEVLFLEKFIRNIGKADARIFVAVKRGVQVEVADVKTGGACITARDDTVEDKFFKFKASCGRADVARIEILIPANGNARAIGVILVEYDLAHRIPCANLGGCPHS